jgi:hypothetical protein
MIDQKIDALITETAARLRQQWAEMTPAQKALLAGQTMAGPPLQAMQHADEAEHQRRRDEAAGIKTIRLTGDPFGGDAAPGTVLQFNDEGPMRILSVAHEAGDVVLRMESVREPPTPLTVDEFNQLADAVAQAQNPRHRAPKLSKHDIRRQNRQAKDMWRKR